MNTLICRNNQRRETVRARHDLNGLDYVEVGQDRTTLTVFFLGKSPLSLQADNVMIEGGRRIRDIRVTRVEVTQTGMAELDDFMEVTLDRSGDFSTYTLKVVEWDKEANRWLPHRQFDQHYNRVEFSFDSGECSSDLDCRQQAGCLPEQRPEPDINYLAKDYASFRQLMYDRLALTVPGWKERHVPDLGVTLVELLAYVGDHLSYYQDAVATEAYLDTARQRISVRRHVRLLDYPMHEGCNSRTWICVQTDSYFELPDDTYFITQLDKIPSVIREEDLNKQVNGGYEVFEPIRVGSLVQRFYPGLHEIPFYDWGDKECCLRKGATSATLLGDFTATSNKGSETSQDSLGNQHMPQLHPGDVLIMEEVIGPETGNPADANPKHRHAVRLTIVRQVTDPLAPAQPLTEIEWAEEDALPFPLCISVQNKEPPCGLTTNISIARGNLVLVDHGLSVVEELPPVPVEKTLRSCDCLGGETGTVNIPRRFEPLLEKTPLVFRQPLAAGLPASRMLQQDEREALPPVELFGLPQHQGEGASPQVVAEQWLPQRDLLASGKRDRHFVVEMEDNGRGRLRFGDGELGVRPEADTVFQAHYRVGGGSVGNIGAHGIAHLVTRNVHISVGGVRIFNPLPAVGGKTPEPLAEVRLFAPHAMRKRLERAITAEDYADIVLREFPHKVQRAAARLVWNGSWHEVLLAIDPLGRDTADEPLLTEITARLHRYRRMGHDLVVKSAQQVPLHIEMEICVLPGYLRGHVKAALLDVFSNRRLADGRLGFFHPDNLTFGEGIFLSKLVATAQSVQGVESADVTVLQRLYVPANQELENGVLPLGPFEIARLDNDPSLPEYGKFYLKMGGGR